MVKTLCMLPIILGWVKEERKKKKMKGQIFPLNYFLNNL